MPSKKLRYLAAIQKIKAGVKSDVDFLISFKKNLDYQSYANHYFAPLHELQTLLNCEVGLVAEETLTNPCK
jgi:predicted nucleotidyltransferase